MKINKAIIPPSLLHGSVPQITVLTRTFGNLAPMCNEVDHRGMTTAINLNQNMALPAYYALERHLHAKILRLEPAPYPRPSYLTPSTPPRAPVTGCVESYLCATAYVLGGSKNSWFNWHGTTTMSNSTGTIQLNLPEPTPASTPSHLNAAYLRRHQILRM